MPQKPRFTHVGDYFILDRSWAMAQLDVESRHVFKELRGRAGMPGLQGRLSPLAVLWTIIRCERTRASQVLTHFGTDLHVLERELHDVLGQNPPDSGHVVDYTAISEVALLARSEADRLGHSLVGTDHLLIALCCTNDPAATSVLERWHLSYDAVVRAVLSDRGYPIDNPLVLRRDGYRLQQARLRELQFTDYAVQIVTDAIERALSRGILGRVPGIVILWSILRWEKKLASVMLENLGIDLFGLQNEVDAILKAQPSAELGPVQDLTEVAELVDLAVTRSMELSSGYVGAEHLLMAMCDPVSPASSGLFDRHRITLDGIKRELAGTLRPTQGDADSDDMGDE